MQRPLCLSATSILLMLGLASFLYAGAGTNGGPGFLPVDFDFDLMYGTISPTSGSPVNFIATTVNIDAVLADFSNGGDSGVPPAGLDPIVSAGTLGLLGGATGPLNLVLNESGGGTLAITSDSAFQTLDNIWFSNGAVGQIDPSKISDPAAILVEAEALGAFSATTGPQSVLLSSAGSVDFTNTVSQIVNPGGDISYILASDIALEKLDFSTGQASVPEPSLGWLGLLVFGAMVWRLRLQFRSEMSSRPLSGSARGPRPDIYYRRQLSCIRRRPQ
ncbi:MAG TPA: hypothetical protein VFW44_22900 [Bryobacteraceae bacterium]|nr:hypothetical protein [Bryobacteraceae bacterium]